MKKLVADLARRAWQRGDWIGRVVAVAVVLGGALLLGGTRPALQYWRRTSGAQCGMGRDAAPRRAEALLKASGLAVVRLPQAGSDPQWRAGEVEIRHLAMHMPCDDALALRIQVVPQLQGITVEQLEAFPVRLSFETGGALFTTDKGGLWMLRILPLARSQASEVAFAASELTSLAAAWRSGWLEQAKGIASGAQRPPASMRFRPGRDPVSVLRQTEEMLAKYGAATDATPTGR